MKLYTYTLKREGGSVISVCRIQARGWTHAQQQADALGWPEGAVFGELMRHAKGSTLEECDSCDGVGLMEGWNRRDGTSCPKCHGAGSVVLTAAA